MPELRPFRGLRYSKRAGNLGDLVAPPYDVIDSEQFAQLSARSPRNVVRLILHKGYSPDVLPPAEWYPEAARLLAAWRRDALLVPEDKPAFYLYTQTFTHDGRRCRRKLLLGALRLEAYGAGRVFPHENTTPGPKKSRLLLTQACKANLSPILAFFPDPDGSVNEKLEALHQLAPVAEFVDTAGIGHELRVVSAPDQQAAVAQAVAPLPLYIADGHHRYETAVVYRDMERAKLPQATGELPLDFMLAACMSGADPGMVIRPTHRVVTWQGDTRVSTLLDEARTSFSVRRLGGTLADALAALSRRRHETLFALYGGRESGYYELELNDPEALRDGPYPATSPLRRLPAAVFTQAFLLRQPALREAKVLYTADADLAVRQVDSARQSLACLLPGVSPEELMAVVNAGERMPPKSTYFWPKPLTGMVLRSLDIF